MAQPHFMEEGTGLCTGKTTITGLLNQTTSTGGSLVISSALVQVTTRDLFSLQEEVGALMKPLIFTCSRSAIVGSNRYMTMLGVSDATSVSFLNA